MTTQTNGATLRLLLLLQRQRPSNVVSSALEKQLSNVPVVHMAGRRESSSFTDTSGVTNYTWCPSNVLHPPHKLSTGHGCLVLNRRICIPPSIAQQLWENAEIRCAVDGGANRWRDFMNECCHGRKIKPPDLITGDFDSITKATKKFFCEPPCKYVHTPDQNETDFTKAVRVLQPLLEQQKMHNIVVFHDSSGRFDQIMANINTLYKVQSTTLHVYLLSGWSMAWLLRPGKHKIFVPPELVEQQRWCSLIPVGAPAQHVTTTGLKWDLKNDALEFGGMVSTSNTYADEEVHVETDSELIWSMGLWSPEPDD